MSSNSPKIYNWERYWIPYEEDIINNYSFSHTNTFKEKNFTLADLRNEHVLILLGDAALGKSTCLLQEEKDLKAQNIPCKLINLKGISSENWLKTKLVEFKQEIKNKSEAFLLLDSFDEGHLIFSNLVDVLIDELTTLPLEKIHLRIACRTVVFPKYLWAELKKLKYQKTSKANKNGKSAKIYEIALNNISTTGVAQIEEEFINVKTYKFLPLNINDINLVLDEKNINKDRFYQELPLREELKTPITALYIINEYPEILNKSKYEIYQDISLKLCQELCANRKGILNANERYYISTIIATLMTFSNKQFISYITEQTEFDITEKLYLQKYSSDIRNIMNITKLSIPVGNVEEVLNTGLYTGETDNVYFIQKTYQEFLTADFILENNLYSNFKNLIFDEYDKILPQFSNMVSWLAEKNNEIFEELLIKDPEVLLISIVNFSDLEKNKKMFKKFFELIKENSALGRHSLSDILSKIQLPQEVVESQILELLNDADSYVVALAIKYLVLKEYKIHADKIFEIVVDKNRSVACRNMALYFLSFFNITEKLSLIEQNLETFFVENIENKSRLLAELLNILLPSYISLENIGIIFEQNLSERFYQDLDAENIIKDNVKFQLIFNELIFPLLSEEKYIHNYFREKLIEELSEKLYIEPDLKYFCETLNKSIGCHDLSKTRSILHKYVEQLSKKDKYKIFDCYFEMFENNMSDKLYFSYYRWFFNKTDTLFLLNQYLKIKNTECKKFMWELFLYCSILSIITINANKIKFFIKNITKDIIEAIKKKKITYHEYHLKSLIDNVKDFFENIIEKINDAYREFSGKTPIGGIKKEIKNFLNYKNAAAWNNIVYALNFIKNDGKTYNYSIPIDIQLMDGWQLFTQDEKNLLIEIATYNLKYKQVSNETKIKKLTTNTIYPFQELLFAPAFVLLLNNDIEKFNSLINNNPNIIEKSLIFLIQYHIYSNDEKQEKLKQDILSTLLQLKEAEFIAEMGKIIDILIDGAYETYFDLLKSFYEIENENLNLLLLERLKMLSELEISDIRLALFEHIAKYLVIKNDANTRLYLEELIQKEEISSNLKALSAYLLTHYESSSFNVYKELLPQDETFAKIFFQKLAKDSCIITRNYPDSIKPKFNQIELAQIYIILEQYYPASEDVFADGFVTPRHEITDFRNSISNYAINSGYLDFFEYIKNNSNIKINNSWVERTKRNYTEIIYKYIGLDDLFELILHTDKRVIYNNKHLFDVVIETLEKLKIEFRQDATYIRVWNETKNGHNIILTPKEETALSDEIVRELKKKLKYVLINREVQIQPKTGGSGNQNVDIKIDCILDEHNTATTLIEVKGCWHTELRASIKEQLVDLYLNPDNGYKYGIYLIGWYWCEKWTPEDKKSKINNIRVENRFNNIDEMTTFFERQSVALSDNKKQIKSMIFDLSVPD